MVHMLIAEWCRRAEEKVAHLFDRSGCQTSAIKVTLGASPPSACVLFVSPLLIAPSRLQSRPPPSAPGLPSPRGSNSLITETPSDENDPILLCSVSFSMTFSFPLPVSLSFHASCSKLSSKTRALPETASLVSKPTRRRERPLAGARIGRWTLSFLLVGPEGQLHATHVRKQHHIWSDEAQRRT